MRLGAAWPQASNLHVLPVVRPVHCVLGLSLALVGTRHYLSDVVFGAAMGIAGERTVMRSGRYRVRVAPAAGPKAAALMIVVSPGP